MSARSDLFVKLTDELSMGWPAPWHPQDRAAASMLLGTCQLRALEDYIGIVGQVVTEAHGHGPVVVRIDGGAA